MVRAGLTILKEFKHEGAAATRTEGCQVSVRPKILSS